jgi:hypothetical protein
VGAACDLIHTGAGKAAFEKKLTGGIEDTRIHLPGELARRPPRALCDRDGTLIPFARTRSEREAAGDPRPSLEERYGSRENYIARVEAAAAGLVADRLLLRADAAAYINAARERDRF